MDTPTILNFGAINAYSSPKGENCTLMVVDELCQALKLTAQKTHFKDGVVSKN